MLEVKNEYLNLLEDMAAAFNAAADETYKEGKIKKRGETTTAEDMLKTALCFFALTQYPEIYFKHFPPLYRKRPPGEKVIHKFKK